ncbi:sigma-70 family RNA polymerase sigma factor [Nonomuraea sp. NPDC050556]|uniref:sigma-70 family RNA polymerase sigma factor n=1 Tax=Nonomuraea sp. NPDC050556 TaxID=3364369 RepID=UPI0037AA711F
MSDKEPEPEPLPQAMAVRNTFRAAFEAFVRDEYVPVQRFVIAACGASREESQEVAQETFAEACRLFMTQPSRWAAIEDHRAYIRAVARRLLIRLRDQPRRRRSTVPLDLDQPQHDTQAKEWAEDVAVAMDVRKALDTLPADQRLLLAYHRDGFTYAAIGTYLGLTEQQARDLGKKARAAMKTSLAGYRDSGRDAGDRSRS